MTSQPITSGHKLMKVIHDQFLVCKICLEKYRQPKTLTCLHTFCEECLVRLLDAQQERSYRYLLYSRPFLSCPVCRNPTDLPPGGVKRLPDNFLVSSLDSIIGRRTPSGGPATPRATTPTCEICCRGNGRQGATAVKDQPCRTQPEAAGGREVEPSKRQPSGFRKEQYIRRNRHEIDDVTTSEYLAEVDKYTRQFRAAQLAKTNQLITKTKSPVTSHIKQREIRERRDLRSEETDEKAVSKCLDCCKYLCQFCAGLHRSTKVTQDHSLVDVEVEEKDVECSRHEGELIRFYCEPCSRCICVVCAFQDHCHHDVSTLSEGVDRHRHSMDDLVSQCRDRCDRLRQHVDLIRACEGEMDRVEGQIRDTAEEGINTIRRREQEILTSLTERFNSGKVRDFLSRKDEFEAELQSLESTCYLTDVITKERSVELLLLKDEISRKMTSLLEQSRSDSPPDCLKKRISFVPGNLVFGYLSMDSPTNLSLADELDMKSVEGRECAENNNSVMMGEKYVENNSKKLDQQFMDHFINGTLKEGSIAAKHTASKEGIRESNNGDNYQGDGQAKRRKMADEDVSIQEWCPERDTGLVDKSCEEENSRRSRIEMCDKETMTRKTSLRRRTERPRVQTCSRSTTTNSTVHVLHQLTNTEPSLNYATNLSSENGAVLDGRTERGSSEQIKRARSISPAQRTPKPRSGGQTRFSHRKNQIFLITRSLSNPFPDNIKHDDGRQVLEEVTNEEQNKEYLQEPSAHTRADSCPVGCKSNTPGDGYYTEVIVSRHPASTRPTQGQLFKRRSSTGSALEPLRSRAKSVERVESLLRVPLGRSSVMLHAGNNDTRMTRSANESLMSEYNVMDVPGHEWMTGKSEPSNVGYSSQLSVNLEKERVNETEKIPRRCRTTVSFPLQRNFEDPQQFNISLEHLVSHNNTIIQGESIIDVEGIQDGTPVEVKLAHHLVNESTDNSSNNEFINSINQNGVTSSQFIHSNHNGTSVCNMSSDSADISLATKSTYLDKFVQTSASPPSNESKLVDKASGIDYSLPHCRDLQTNTGVLVDKYSGSDFELPMLISSATNTAICIDICLGSDTLLPFRQDTATNEMNNSDARMNNTEINSIPSVENNLLNYDSQKKCETETLTSIYKTEELHDAQHFRQIQNITDQFNTETGVDVEKVEGSDQKYETKLQKDEQISERFETFNTTLSQEGGNMSEVKTTQQDAISTERNDTLEKVHHEVYPNYSDKIKSENLENFTEVAAEDKPCTGYDADKINLEPSEEVTADENEFNNKDKISSELIAAVKSPPSITTDKDFSGNRFRDKTGESIDVYEPINGRESFALSAPDNFKLLSQTKRESSETGLNDQIPNNAESFKDKNCNDLEFTRNMTLEPRSDKNTEENKAQVLQPTQSVMHCIQNNTEFYNTQSTAQVYRPNNNSEVHNVREFNTHEEILNNSAEIPANTHANNNNIKVDGVVATNKTNGKPPRPTAKVTEASNPNHFNVCFRASRNPRVVRRCRSLSSVESTDNLNHWDLYQDLYPRQELNLEPMTLQKTVETISRGSSPIDLESPSVNEPDSKSVLEKLEKLLQNEVIVAEDHTTVAHELLEIQSAEECDTTDIESSQSGSSLVDKRVKLMKISGPDKVDVGTESDDLKRLTESEVHRSCNTSPLTLQDSATGERSVVYTDSSTVYDVTSVSRFNKETNTPITLHINASVGTGSCNTSDAATSTPVDITAAYRQLVASGPHVTVSRGTSTLPQATNERETNTSPTPTNERGSSPVRYTTHDKAVMANEGVRREGTKEIYQCSTTPKPVIPKAVQEQPKLDSIVEGSDEGSSEEDKFSTRMERKPVEKSRKPSAGFGSRLRNPADRSKGLVHKVTLIPTAESVKPAQGKSAQTRDCSGSGMSVFGREGSQAASPIIWRLEKGTNTSVQLVDSSTSTDSVEVNGKMAECISKLRTVRERLEQQSPPLPPRAILLGKTATSPDPLIRAGGGEGTIEPPQGMSRLLSRWNDGQTDTIRALTSPSLHQRKRIVAEAAAMQQQRRAQLKLLHQQQRVEALTESSESEGNVRELADTTVPETPDSQKQSVSPSLARKQRLDLRHLLTSFTLPTRTEKPKSAHQSPLAALGRVAAAAGSALGRSIMPDRMGGRKVAPNLENKRELTKQIDVGQVSQSTEQRIGKIRKTSSPSSSTSSSLSSSSNTLPPVGEGLESVQGEQGRVTKQNPARKLLLVPKSSLIYEKRPSASLAKQSNTKQRPKTAGSNDRNGRMVKNQTDTPGSANPVKVIRPRSATLRAHTRENAGDITTLNTKLSALESSSDTSLMSGEPEEDSRLQDEPFSAPPSSSTDDMGSSEYHSVSSELDQSWLDEERQVKDWRDNISRHGNSIKPGQHVAVMGSRENESRALKDVSFMDGLNVRRDHNVAVSNNKIKQQAQDHHIIKQLSVDTAAKVKLRAAAVRPEGSEVKLRAAAMRPEGSEVKLRAAAVRPEAAESDDSAGVAAATVVTSAAAAAVERRLPPRSPSHEQIKPNLTPVSSPKEDVDEVTDSVRHRERVGKGVRLVLSQTSRDQEMSPSCMTGCEAAEPCLLRLKHQRGDQAVRHPILKHPSSTSHLRENLSKLDAFCETEESELTTRQNLPKRAAPLTTFEEEGGFSAQTKESADMISSQKKGDALPALPKPRPVKSLAKAKVADRARLADGKRMNKYFS